MKPKSGGRPPIDSAASRAAAKVTGIGPRRPPRCVMSRVPVSWSMTPATMNSAALEERMRDEVEHRRLDRLFACRNRSACTSSPSEATVV